MKKYLGFIIVTIIIGCTKEMPIIKENNQIVVEPLNYKGLSSNQIRLLSKEYIDVSFYDSKINCWEYGDFDLDGDEDVVALRLSNKPLFIRNQKGIFSNIETIFDDSSYAVWPRSSISGDYNNDGYLDVVVFSHDYEGANGGENVTLLLNQNGKSFKTKIISPIIRGTTKNFWHLGSSADIDKDGDIDILMSTAGQQYLMLNDGNANFTLATSYEQSLQNSHMIGAILEDINKDGYIDFLSYGHEFAQTGLNYHNGPSKTRIMWGNTQYSFLFSNSKTFEMNMDGFALIIDAISVDLNKDGKNEIILLRTGDPVNSIFYKGYSICVYDSQSLQDITADLFGSSIQNKNSNWIVFIKVGDFNNDGKLDIADSKKKSSLIFYQK